MHSSEIDSQCTKKYICSGNTANRSQERVVPNDHDETRNNGPREKALSWRVKLSFAIGLLSGGAMVYFLPKLLWKYK